MGHNLQSSRVEHSFRFLQAVQQQPHLYLHKLILSQLWCRHAGRTFQLSCSPVLFCTTVHITFGPKCKEQQQHPVMTAEQPRIGPCSPFLNTYILSMMMRLGEPSQASHSLNSAIHALHQSKHCGMSLSRCTTQTIGRLKAPAGRARHRLPYKSPPATAAKLVSYMLKHLTPDSDPHQLLTGLLCSNRHQMYALQMYVVEVQGWQRFVLQPTQDLGPLL